MTNPFLLLWLEAPIQSWGFESRYGRRDTLDFPTRSGVLGLICCARGAGGREASWLAEMGKFGQNVLCFQQKPRHNSFEPATANGRLLDFQMVGNGYISSDPWQNLMIPKTVEGKKPTGSNGSKLTYRYYLQNMAFAVIMQIPHELGEDIVHSLQYPHWNIYLGRKCCPPSDIVYRGLFVTNSEAKSVAFEIASKKELECTKEILEGSFPDQGEVLTLHDVPVQFGFEKLYRDRQVTILNEPSTS